MKLLFPLLLCLLLSGCASPTNHALVPQSQQEFQEAAAILQSQYANGVNAVSLPVNQTEQMWNTGSGILLQNGWELVLLDDAFQSAASCTLNFVPEISVSRQVISAFDPESRQLLLLTPTLAESRRITLPLELSGRPFVSGDGGAVYYCTDQGIYCWDLSSGIRRRIRESIGGAQSLVGLHREDSVLQFRLEDRDLFLDAQSGQLLLEMPTPVQLTTDGENYYCIFSAGAVENLVFGKSPEAPQALFPAEVSSNTRFLPELHAAVTVHPDADDSYRLACYALGSGRLQDSLSLHQKPKAILGQGDGSILLLVSHQGQDVLLKWQPESNGSDNRKYTDPYFTADRPDHAGLALCREYAQSLAEKFGLEILIWKDAAAVKPWDYTFQPEHRYPVLLAQLQTLETCLSRYPREILEQTVAHFDTLSLCLVQSITGLAGEESLTSATGVQFLNGSDAYVTLAAGPYLEQALYHELFHVMETHILSCSSKLDRWDELNPAGFAYDLNHSANARRNSGVYLENGTRAFIDTYSMSFPKEDRARIFEYAMLPHMDHLFRSDAMQQKLSAVCSSIRDAYNLEKYPEPLPWEQYLE